MDKSALNFDFILINAGERGLLFKLNPNDFINASKAIVSDIIR